MKSIRIIDEFGIDITKIVDVIVEGNQVQVIDEIGCDITKLVDIVIE